MQVIEIPDTAPTGQQVASRVPLSDPVAVEYAERGLLASDAQVLAVSSPLDAGSGGVVGSLPFTTRTVTADTAAHPGELLEVDASGGEIVITPPPHPLPGAYATVVKIDTSPNLVRWDAPVNGDPQGAAIQGPMAAATFVYDGDRWLVESVNTSYNAASLGGINAEDAADVTATMFAAGTHTNITFAYNDAVGSMSATVPTPTWSAVAGKPTFAAVATSGSAADLTAGTIDDARIPPGIARDSEVTAATATKADLSYVQRRQLRPLPAPAVTQNNTTPLPNGLSGTQTSRFVFPVKSPCSYVQLVFPNFNISTGVDTAAASSLTIKASVEDGSTLVPLAFNGQTSMTIGSGMITTDPIMLDRFTGDSIFIRTYISSGSPYATKVTIPDNGEGVTATTDLTPPGSAAVGLTFQYAYGPMAVLGNGDPWGITLGISGDSIAYGQGDIINAGRNAGALVRAANTANLPFIQVTNPGERLYNILNAGAFSYRGPLLASCTHVISNYGRNDITDQVPPELTEANMVTWWRRYRKSARFVGHTTITPRTTSTDAWATTTNQTVANTTEEAIRVAVNTWLRDGAPINSSTFAVMAAGTSSGSAVRMGTAPHPLSALYEWADVVETSRNSGIWKATYTDDGLHPNGNGYAPMAAATNLSTLV